MNTSTWFLHDGTWYRIDAITMVSDILMRSYDQGIYGIMVVFSFSFLVGSKMINVTDAISLTRFKPGRKWGILRIENENYSELSDMSKMREEFLKAKRPDLSFYGFLAEKWGMPENYERIKAKHKTLTALLDKKEVWV